MSGDSQLGADASDAPFDELIDAQSRRNSPDVLVLSFKGKRRGSRGHSQSLDLRERGDEIFTKTVSEIFVVRIGAAIDEGQYRHRSNFFGLCRKIRADPLVVKNL